jgi:class 3 adenylate cyclase
MPIYLDRHYVQGATRHAVANAHEKDLQIQHKHGLQFLTYWFDETRSTAFCLVNAPSKEAVSTAHNEAHGLVPSEILEVDPNIIESFLGRINDPAPVPEKPDEVPIDSAFRTIMFTDLKDSTLMTTMFGDAKALHLLHVHNLLIRDALKNHRGREVKHTGDGIMASFASATDAVQCAISIQRGFTGHNIAQPDTPMYVRIGMSAGEPIEEHGDVFGKTVQLAARICAHAEPGQIVLDQSVKDAIVNADLSLSTLGEVIPKGFNQSVRLYQVDLI